MKILKITQYIGQALIVFGIIYLLVTYSTAYLYQPDVAYNTGGELVSAPPSDEEVDYLGWGALIFGFMTLGLTSYFQIRADRRAERAEKRQIARDEALLQATGQAGQAPTPAPNPAPTPAPKLEDQPGLDGHPDGTKGD